MGLAGEAVRARSLARQQGGALTEEEAEHLGKTETGQIDLLYREP